jgi:hypothetical protein
MTAPPRRPDLVPISDIVAGLAADIEALCRELLPQGRISGGAEWVVAGKDSPFGCSVSVHLRAPKKGIWKAWAAVNCGGDALDLVAHVACRGDMREAIRWARDWLGHQPVPVPAERERRAREAKSQAAIEEKRRSNAALAMWLHAQPSLKGTPAELYLRNRGIDISRIGRQPRALRYHPALYDDGQTGRHWPAIVALLSNGGGAAVHRIWLTPDGHKAPIANPKRSYGPKRGGIIPLWRGHTQKSMRDAEPGSSVWISEGIEDGLSIAIMTGGTERVIAAVDLSNMGAVRLPPAIGTVIIVAQNDQWWHMRQGQPHGAALGLDRAIRHFEAEGRQVRVWRPNRADCKDANDLLRMTCSEERVA